MADSVFLSGLLPLWLFPLRLLPLLIACGLRPETAQPGLPWTPDAARWLARAEAENHKPHWSCPEQGDYSAHSVRTVRETKRSTFASRSQLEQRRADVDRYRQSGTEPTLNEMLREPAIRLMMTRDNVTEDQLLHLIKLACRHIKG